jgi:septal ring factor EnvC (AmiA/AmiB activator)
MSARRERPVTVVSTSLNLISLLFTILAVVVAAIVVMAQARRVSHEQLTQTAKDWQDVATARTERVTMLEQQLAGLQSQMLEMAGRIAAFERDQDYLERRNRELGQKLERSEVRVEVLEQLLGQHQILVPKRPSLGQEEAA